ncbi:MarR family transcriptional regulator [Virgibacillus pantothenticus]|uniref:MarR family winged helix-turn-helix transcriptional regulator n=1 Tax=Virgibacillus pantothenticus TaxID=1473 RepID=UPI001C213B43|nr:MarR family transcriptional regulator [Virgibacillus pantothenticus]MBU8565293.1 MarR family transcriptional regulator [Virgibacillus pantothenticus]MBU8599488.1 MarR family transcriptional regulator [Virgibacillus pantothenticus]MBU8633612.1 MarR family transcriptional regulator [Virgibacillus pantothenticus]MBU8641768.1 MarR family transcriptional regulator [Virgibacillus pantothenticus]MBU8645491.1 MarR family transcriptional regulator [Virgibacillus pantothenticus]
MKENLSLKAFVVLIKASKALQDHVMEDIKNYGMKTSEFTILETLYHKGKQTVREISNSVLIKTGSITYVIDRLEEKGMLQREHCQKDRRVVYIDITDEGKNLMDEIFPKHQKVIEELFTDISDEQKQTVIDMLKKVGKRL